MLKQKIELGSGAIALSNRIADKLIDLSNGDAALLYLYLLRCGGSLDTPAAAKALHWTEPRVTEALDELERQELVKGPSVEPGPAVRAGDAPDYSKEQIRQELETNHSVFRALLNEVERKLGDKQPYQNIKMLMELYDYLSLPAEVILLLVTHMIDEVAYRKGPYIKPRMWEIKREGYRWSTKGIDNLDAATAYVRKLNYFRSNEGKILSVIGIHDRTATDREKTYINAWLEMGFEDGVVQMAYERTMFKTQNWNWNYCNGILKSWHKDGLHTLNAILDAEEKRLASRRQPRDKQAAQTAPETKKPAAANADQLEDIRWMQAFMKKYQAGNLPEGTGGH